MYIILEIQEAASGSIPNTITYTAETMDEAMSKYHYILHYASISNLLRHGAIIMTTDGKYVARECYKHVDGETDVTS